MSTARTSKAAEGQVIIELFEVDGPDPRGRGVVDDYLQHIARGVAHRGLAGEIEAHAADIGFVHDVRRQDLDRDRSTIGQKRQRGCRGLVGVARQRRRSGRDRVGRQQR